MFHLMALKFLAKTIISRSYLEHKLWKLVGRLSATRHELKQIEGKLFLLLIWYRKTGATISCFDALLFPCLQLVPLHFFSTTKRTSLSQVKSKGKTAIPTWCSAISYPIHKHLLRVMNELPCNWPLHITSDVPGLLFPTLQVKHIPGIYSKPITPNLPYLVLLRIKNILFVFSILYFSARHTKS